MKPKDFQLAQKLDARLSLFDQQIRPLPGIQAPANRNAFLEQLVESIHRVKYVSVIRTRKLSNLRSDPSNKLFDPLKAALLCQHQGQIDEAFWLLFFFVHFGKHAHDGWRLARDVYGRMGGKLRWDWARTSSDPMGFRKWLAEHEAALRGDGVSRRFGNHRKYESLKDSSRRGTAAVVESYVKWVHPPRTHEMLVQDALKQVGQNPRQAFNYLYRSMDAVMSFGRTARFDYLTMIGKLGLAPIEPGSTYMKGATGPLSGARMLFGENTARPTDIEEWLVELEARIETDFGMQVLEDALCNWQKNPEKFIPFRG